jgi:hypothetical protein
MRGQPGRVRDFRLAMALGYPHPRYLDEQLTSIDKAEWEAYGRIEPYGMHWMELLLGRISFEVFNGAHDQARPFDEFLPSHESPEMSHEEILNAVRRAKGH